MTAHSPAVDTPERGPSGAPAASAGQRTEGMQRQANDRVWEHGQNLGVYANRDLRPVEVDILVRFRDALSGRVLELGCGAGRLTGYLADIAELVRGIDLSEEMLDYSRQRYPKATFDQGDLRDAAAFSGAPFDAIVMAFNIVDVLGDDDRQALLDRIHGALAPDGLLILSSTIEPTRRT